MIATPLPPGLPGEGQARIAVVTGAWLSSRVWWPAASTTGWLIVASP